MKNILFVCLVAALFSVVGCQSKEVTVVPPAQQSPNVIVAPSRPNVIVVPGRAPHHHHCPPPRDNIHIRTPGADINIRK